MEGISSFFFNIIPGAVFIFILEKYSNFKVISETLKIDPKNENILFWLIIFSIFIGFFLQALTKWVKEKILYPIVWCKVKSKDTENFNAAERYLLEKELLFDNEVGEKRMKRMFFTMDDYISLDGGGRLLPHFSSRLAYWFNLFWVSLAILFISKNIKDDAIVTLALIVLIISACETWVHLEDHYEILLKAFISHIKIDREDGFNIVRRNQRKQK